MNKGKKIRHSKQYQPKPRAVFYAEALREVGVLTMIFGPLYVVFDGHIERWQDWNLVWKWAIGGALPFFVGVELERRIRW